MIKHVIGGSYSYAYTLGLQKMPKYKLIHSISHFNRFAQNNKLIPVELIHKVI